MEFQNSLAFAQAMDEQDPLKAFRQKFILPQHNSQDAIYFCGNSLGLQPKSVKDILQEELDAWATMGVEGWFKGNKPWLGYHRELAPALAGLAGAETNEVSVMNSLTVNLHLLLVSFYKPTRYKYKILVEAGAFPSDQYAVASQVNFHGFSAADAIVVIGPREGEHILRTEDILNKIEEHAESVALVLFGGVNYYTGQFFDLQAITAAAHRAGAYAGFDLAHTVGNVPLQLHGWDIDFACWCSYKYLNSGPGAIGGIFVHQKHFNNNTLPRFAGWWGYREDKRFLMEQPFEPATGADGWQVSTSPILLLSVHKAALDLFDEAGGMAPLRNKGMLLTAFLEFIIQNINRQFGEALFNIITPASPDDRGSQLSIICKRNGKAIFNFLESQGVIGDWREPDVIRLSPAPLYNSFTDVYTAGTYLLAAVKNSITD
jgi:kynureninase